MNNALYNPNFKEAEELQLKAYQMSLIKPYTFDRIQIFLGQKNKA